MKKFALIVASLVIFAGCARNDTTDMTETGDPAATDTTTATGSPATTQTGTDAAMQTDPMLRDTNAPAGSPRINTAPDITAEGSASGSLQTEPATQPDPNQPAQPLPPERQQQQQPQP